MLAGRGAGKTRTAAEQVGWWAWTEPGTRWLVGAPTSSDVRATCFEGDSGLLSVIPAQLITDYNRAFHELKLTNGSLIKGIPASEPERFRGPQFHGAWLDELAAWDYLQEAWDQIMFGVRLGNKTRILATTTPKPKDSDHGSGGQGRRRRNGYSGFHLREPGEPCAILPEADPAVRGYPAGQAGDLRRDHRP
jgi:phage terminase large subunit-like protein